MKLIMLTIFDRRRYPTGSPATIPHGRFVWVNPAYIETMEVISTDIFREEADTKRPSKDRDREEFTCITFNAGSSEDPHTVWVCEGPPRIMRTIAAAEEF